MAHRKLFRPASIDPLGYGRPQVRDCRSGDHGSQGRHARDFSAPAHPALGGRSLRAYDRDDQNLGQDALIALALGIDPAPRPFVTCGPDVFETRRESFSLLMIEKNVSGQGVVVAVADPSPRPW